MKINRSAGSFARGTDTVERALTLNVHSDGAVSLTTDVAGARVEVTQADDGKVTVAEVLADGSAGESVTIETVAPPALAPDAEVAKRR